MGIYRFIIAIALLGVAFCMLVAALAPTDIGLVTSSAVHHAIGAVSFICFALAILAHPKARRRGGSHSVSYRQLWRTAARWFLVLEAATFIALAIASFRLEGPRETDGGGCTYSSPSTAFSVDTRMLRGRPDRIQILAAFHAVFLATSALVASSAQAEQRRRASGP